MHVIPKLGEVLLSVVFAMIATMPCNSSLTKYVHLLSSRLQTQTTNRMWKSCRTSLEKLAIQSNCTGIRLPFRFLDCKILFLWACGWIHSSHTNKNGRHCRINDIRLTKDNHTLGAKGSRRGRHAWHRRRDGGDRGSCKTQWWRRVICHGVSARFCHRQSFSQRRQHLQSFWKISESTSESRFVSKWAIFILVVLLGGGRSAANTPVIASATRQPCRRFRCFESSKNSKQQQWWRSRTATTATATRIRHRWRLLIEIIGWINQGACWSKPSNRWYLIKLKIGSMSCG